MINLESKCDWDNLLAYRASTVDKRYVEAVNVIREHRVQEFLDSKLP
ncbi:MAG TPA: hypothetical protein PK357_01010 [Candidatus Pacearchaeota archaeon]|nr:hypothetical protein [Candidatus Pacearchaeota archaeon]